MSCGCSFGASIPEDWNNRLEDTIQRIKGYGNSSGRYLLIVTKSWGDSFEYPGSFPKSSSRVASVIASVDLNRSESALVDWVIDNIPS